MKLKHALRALFDSKGIVEKAAGIKRDDCNYFCIMEHVQKQNLHLGRFGRKVLFELSK